MFSTLQAAFGTWPSDSSHRGGAESDNAQSSGLNETITFGDEDETPPASAVFVVTSKHFPTTRPFIPPYFRPPGTTAINQGDGDVAVRLQHVLQENVAGTETRVSVGPSQDVDPALQRLRPLASKQFEVRSDSGSTKRRRESQSEQAQRSPSPAPVSVDVDRERELSWSDSARQAFHNLITSPGYVNRYRLSRAKYRRLLTYLQNPEVEPTLSDGSKDHQTRYQAANWVLRDGTLYRRAEGKAGGAGLRRHLDVDEVWDVLTAEHLRHGHVGRDRLRRVLEKRFIGYTLQEIMFVLRECKRCNGSERRVADVRPDSEGIEEQSQSARMEESIEANSTHVQESESAFLNSPFPRRQTSNMMWF